MLLLCKHEYLTDHQGLKAELEIYMKLLVYFMVILLILRLVAEIKNAVDCKCNSSSVVPSDTVKAKKKHKKKNKNRMEEKLPQEK